MFQTEQDTMTGLPNLISLVSGLKELSQNHGVLVIVDLNDFAQFNQRHGRPTGDRVVLALTDALRLACRESGGSGSQPYRIGGDEFLLVLEGADRDGASQAAKRVKELFLRQLEEQDLPRVGLSHAMADYPEHGPSLGALLARLYLGLRARDRAATVPAPDWVEDLVNWFIRRVSATVDELAETRRQALTDAVSGLPNHRAGEATLESMIRQHDQLKRPFAILFLDGDDLKFYNESFGYERGNEMIGRLGATISANLREQDFVCRWLMGDEFIVLLPGADREHGRQVGERLRRAVTAASRDWPLPVTVSVGLASFPDDGLQAHDLLSEAAEANARAKQAGKNRVL